MPPALDDIAQFHARFEQIHPFQDGNGRVGRIVLFRQCLASGLVPLIVQDENRKEYTSCLKAAQESGETATLTRYFAKEQAAYHNNANSRPMYEAIGTNRPFSCRIAQ